VTPGSFEPTAHFYPRVLNAHIHPIVRTFVSLGNARIAKRYCHLHPEAQPAAVAAALRKARPRPALQGMSYARRRGGLGDSATSPADAPRGLGLLTGGSHSRASAAGAQRTGGAVLPAGGAAVHGRRRALHPTVLHRCAPACGAGQPLTLPQPYPRCCTTSNGRARTCL